MTERELHHLNQLCQLFRRDGVSLHLLFKRLHPLLELRALASNL